MKGFLRRHQLLLLLLLTICSCTELEEKSSIPDHEVYIKTFGNDYTTLRIAGNSISYIPSQNSVYPTNFRFGFGGVLIYRDMEDKIHACDLACPVEATRNILVEVKMPFATCPSCGSKFDLTFGFASPCEGPAKETLKKYNAIDNGTAIIASY
ncbi:MAG: hypothetical protein J5554_02410 [Paludibacteraceae bacterium]|nr:hypothetical protein [Paludibacteraceae bacterium]